MADSIRKPDDYPDALRPGGRVPAWAVSMLLHVCLILGLFFWLDRQPSGMGQQQDRPVGVAVAHRMADHTVYETPQEQSEQAESEQSSSSTSAAMAAANAPPSAAQPLDIDGLLASVTETPMPEAGGGTSSALEAGSGSGDGPLKDGEGGGPPASTMFFGASGSGRRFVYVFDRSDSMSGKPINAVKQELLRSLDMLGPQQAFQVIFYNNRPSYFEFAGFAMIPADDSMKRRAATFVRAIDPFGGTEHYDAMRMALKLQPDVIFFLTDADLPRLGANELREIRSRCAESKTTVHAIEFGLEPQPANNSFIKVLASQNNGEYRYINVNSL